MSATVLGSCDRHRTGIAFATIAAVVVGFTGMVVANGVAFSAALDDGP